MTQTVARYDPDMSKPSPRDPDAIAIVLAGGAARRLGADRVGPDGKAGLLLAGRTFLDVITATCAACVARVIVVAAPGQSLPDVGVPIEVVRDSTPGAGPLAGIRDGLAHGCAGGSLPKSVVVVSCDAPLLQPAVVRLLLDRLASARALWVVPVVHGHPQVLLSALRPALLGPIERHLAAGRRDVRGLLDQFRRAEPAAIALLEEVEMAAIDPGCRSFLDVDTPADLEALRHR